MRLIDADKFKEKLSYLRYELYNSHPVGELSEDEKDLVGWYIYHISNMVDNMPDTEAIPIEWIEEYTKKLVTKRRFLAEKGYRDNRCYDYMFGIIGMLDDWDTEIREKENEMR